MSNGNICTVGQLVNLLRPIPKDYVVKADDFEIIVKDKENNVVAVISPYHLKKYGGN